MWEHIACRMISRRIPRLAASEIEVLATRGNAELGK